MLFFQGPSRAGSWSSQPRAGQQLAGPFVTYLSSFLVLLDGDTAELPDLLLAMPNTSQQKVLSEISEGFASAIIKNHIIKYEQHFEP